MELLCSAVKGTLPTELTRLLRVAAECYPREARRAESTLQTLLAEDSLNEELADNQDRSDLEPDWCFSRLTPTGFPVEFTAVFPEGDFRYVAQVGGPNVVPHRRLQLAAQRLIQIEAWPRDWFDLDWAEADFCATIQEGSPLNYGAWVGVRHHGDDVQGKLYAEVPADRRTDVERQFVRSLVRSAEIPGVRMELDMIGLQEDPRAVELYYTLLGFHSWQTSAILRPVGLEGQADEVLSGIEQLHGWPVYQTMPGRRHGFSYRFSPAQPPRFSFFAFAEDLFESDALMRRRILRSGRELGWNTQFYARVSQPFVNDGRDNTHTIAGVTIEKGRPPAIHVGLPPPVADPAWEA